MVIYKKIIIGIIVFLGSFNICLAQSSIYESFLINQFNNPAFTQSANNCILLSYQKKYIGFKGSPSLSFFSYKGGINTGKRKKTRFNYGVNLQKFNFGNFKEHYIGVPVSIHIKLNEILKSSWFLSLGFEPTYSQIFIDEKNLILNQTNDPILNNSINTYKEFDANIGFFLYNKVKRSNIRPTKITWNLGVFTVNTLESSFLNSEPYLINKYLFFYSGGFEILKRKNVRLFNSQNNKISTIGIAFKVFLRSLNSTNFYYPHDILILKFCAYKGSENLNKVIEIGLNFRTNGIVIPSYSFSIKKKFKIGIAYGINTSLIIPNKHYKHSMLSLITKNKDNYGNVEIKLKYMF